MSTPNDLESKTDVPDAATSRVTDWTDREFGDSRILRKIGTGAMAEVYLADQRSLDRRIAIKILKPELARDQAYVNRFVREAKSAARLVHPNIVHIYEVDCREGTWYISQEYVQGMNLGVFVQKNGSLTPKRTFEILWQIASALDKASQGGIVHRDIKPENILIGDTGEVKVADFGLARITDTANKDAMQLTQVGMTLGTPLYMSPEQSEGKPTDHRSDIYSLGITTYHMLAGHPPFRGETALAVAIQHLKNEAEPLELIRPDVPPPLARIVRKMMEKSPDTRYQTVRELMIELKQLYGQYFQGTFSAEELADWSMLHLDSSNTSIHVSTERLQSIMAAERTIGEKRSRRLRLAGAAILLAALVGGLSAYGKARLTPSLLPMPVQHSEFPKMDSVAKQWIYAARFNTEEAWRSVIDYFPQETLWCERAKQQLARHYVEYGDTASAETLFQEFSDRDDTEPEYRAFGLSGLMWCRAKNGQYDQAADYFTLLTELKLESYDPQTEYIQTVAIRAMQQPIRKNGE